MNPSLEDQSRRLVDGLMLIKDEYIKTKDQLLVSIRKDVVAAELKDIISSTDNYNSLKTKIEDYAKSLYDIKGEEDGNK